MTKSPHPKRGMSISILLSLLLLQGCVSVSLAEPVEPLRITVSTPIVKSEWVASSKVLDNIVYLLPEYPTLEMYKELEARIKALEEDLSIMRIPTAPYSGMDLMRLESKPYVCQQCGKKFKNRNFNSVCAVNHNGGCCHYNEKEIDSDEEFIRKGKEDVKRMKRLGE